MEKVLNRNRSVLKGHESFTKVKFLIFEDHGSLFAILLEQIVEVIFSSKTSSLPKKTKNLKGVINLRGEVLPVLDIDSLLGNKSIEQNSDQTVIRKYTVIISIGEEKLALQIERVRRITELDTASFEDVKTAVHAGESNLARQIAKVKDDNIIILNFNNIFDTPKTLEGPTHV